MENHGSNKKYIQMRPQRPLGIGRILSEAHKITIKNRKLAVWIILPVLVSYTILGFCSHLFLESVTEDLSAALKSNYYSDPTDSIIGIFTQGDLKDLRYYVGIQLVFLFIYCVILLIFVVASIFSSSEAYIGNVNLSPKDTLLGIKGRIKRPIITSFVMGLISLGLVCFILILFWITFLMTQGYYIFLPISLAAILGVVCYVYVVALWMLSLVVSVLEEDKSCCGLKAIDRASELMKGKRIQGSVLNLIFTIIIGVIDVVFFFISISWNANKLVSLKLTVIMIPRILLICLVKLFMFEVFTVFYHERKRSQEPESELSLSALGGGTGTGEA